VIIWYRGDFDLAKWEYIVLALKTKVHVSRHEREKNPTIQNVQNELNTLGENGWELVGVQNIRLETGMLFTVAYLKREKS
jgi:ribosomal protein S24E